MTKRHNIACPWQWLELGRTEADWFALAEPTAKKWNRAWLLHTNATYREIDGKPNRPGEPRPLDGNVAPLAPSNMTIAEVNQALKENVNEKRELRFNRGVINKRLSKLNAEYPWLVTLKKKISQQKKSIA